MNLTQNTIRTGRRLGRRALAGLALLASADTLLASPPERAEQDVARGPERALIEFLAEFNELDGEQFDLLLSAAERDAPKVTPSSDRDSKPMKEEVSHD